MNRLLRTAALAVASLTMATGTAWSAIQINVTPAYAPNGALNASTFGSWVGNAIPALESGSLPAGPRLQPDDYEVTGPVVLPAEMIVSTFPSWRGVANPAAPFDGQHGNRVHFGLHVWTTDPGDPKFSLQDILYEIDSNDPTDTFDFPEAGDPLPSLSGDYRASLVGIDYVDGIKGNGDDIRYDGSNPAAGSTLVNEIIYVGVGTAYDASTFTGATNQEKIDNLIASVDYTPFTLAAAYQLVLNDTVVGQGSGSTSVVIPEPMGLVLCGLPMIGLFGWARRRRVIRS